MPFRIETTRFGPLDVAEERIITVLGGLCGMPQCTRFVVVDPKGEPGPFRWLQCVDEPAAAFLILDPAAFWPDYQPEVPSQACDLLGLGAPDEAILAAICVVPEDPRQVTANLAAPLVINPVRRSGIQLILADANYSVRQPVFAPADPAPAPVGAP